MDHASLLSIQTGRVRPLGPLCHVSAGSARAHWVRPRRKDSDGPHHRHERREVGLHQGGRIECGQAPALTIAIVAIRRAPHLGVEDEEVLPAPGIGTAAIETHCDIRDEIDALMRG